MSSSPLRPLSLAPQNWAENVVPKLSVFCLTYNHAQFIAQCIDGFLMQETTFPVEIVIHDDASTDETTAIIREYVTKHPRLIRTIFQTTNQFSRGHSPLNLIGQVTRGEFVAICEGDDYWTARDKLQRQVEFLEAHPECSGCFHDAQLVDAESRVLSQSYFQSSQTTFSQRDVIETLLSREPTCSLVFRHAGYDPLPPWFLRRPCDLFLDLHLSSRGPLCFIDRNMAAYRRHAGGIWSSERQAHQLVELIVRFRLLENDETFAPQHRDLLRRKIAEFHAGLFSQSDFDQEMVRLTRLVEEQTTLIDRLRAFAGRAQSDVDALNVQVDQLAETIEQQRAYIAELEQAKSPTGWIGQLQAHAAQSERTITEQHAYITSLEAQRDGLEITVDEHQREAQRLGQICVEQLNYIRSLEAQRKELTASP